MLSELHVHIEVLGRPFFHKQQNGPTNLLRQIEPCNICKDRLTLHPCHIQYFVCHRGKPQRFLFYDFKIFFFLFLREIPTAQQFREASDRNNRRLKLMRKIIDKITAQHLCMLQFLRRPVETLLHLLKGRMPRNRFTEMQPRFEVSVGQPFQLINHSLNWT